MEHRTLGKNGPKISEVGLGCWQLGGDWGDPLSEETGLGILQEAVKQGVTLFDTADVYGGGPLVSRPGFCSKPFICGRSTHFSPIFAISPASVAKTQTSSASCLPPGPRNSRGFTDLSAS